MVLGEIICVIGTGLLTRIDLATSTVEWAAFLVIAGSGLGIGMQLPYTALQVVLRHVAPLYLLEYDNDSSPVRLTCLREMVRMPKVLMAVNGLSLIHEAIAVFSSQLGG